jgi:integrin alpha FG-GAP repeat containing protein 1
MALLSPKSILGLGRISNYVQDFYVGVSRHDAHHSTSFNGIIPNSELVIVPIVKTINSESTTEFKLEMYMNPSSSSFSIVVVLSTIMVILLGMIYMLDVMERREDETERRKKLYELNFDAL